MMIGGFFLYKDFWHSSSNQTNTKSLNSELLSNLSKGLPEAKWSNPENMNQSAGSYGELPGQKITAEITTDDATPVEFGDKKYLESLGFKEDPNLAAGGPGSNVWGYSREVDGVTQVVVFSSETQPTNSNPNQPVEFNCPCKTAVSIFVSDLPKSVDQASSQLANPASVYCGEKGGQTEIKTNPSGDQYGLCQFPDDMACEEWAMYRGECPIGGVKTTGFDNEAQMYCAWVGGKTLAVENATCTLPNGKICLDEDLYSGSCSAS